MSILTSFEDHWKALSDLPPGAALALLVAVCAFVISQFVLKRQAPWTFKFLKPSGETRSGKLEAGLERKRDFMRIVNSGNLLVTTADSTTPTRLTRQLFPQGDGSVSEQDAEAVFQTFSGWLAKQLEGKIAKEGLAERIVGCVNASHGFDFAMKNGVPPMFPDSKFVITIGINGAVQVLWVAFATPEAKANMSVTPFILKLLTANLNSSVAAAEAPTKGVGLQWAVERTDLKRVKALGDFLAGTDFVAALSRGVVDGAWSDVLKSC